MRENISVYDPKQHVLPVTLTESAILHIKKQIAKKPDTIGIRLSVKRQGCSGYAYVVTLVETSSEHDFVFTYDTINVVVNPEDYAFVKGTQIDYVREGLNEKFFYTNPNESGSCGCGESFTVDERKGSRE